MSALAPTGRPLFAAALSVLLLGGCPQSTSPPPPPPADAGPYDAGIDPTLDTDGDGLCDVTEIAMHLDPNDPDTDHDGFSDYAELLFGSNGTQPTSPDRSIVFTMNESSAASVQVPVTVSVVGDGADYVGAFQALPITDLANATAADFFTGAVAKFADPTANVAQVDAMSTAFRGVVGSTRLGYEVRFAFGDNLVRRCNRGYPFRFIVKRTDGRLVFSKSYLLIVVPEGELLTTAAWCLPPSGTCI